MATIRDNTKLRTEDELIEIAKQNAWTVGDVLSNCTGEVKLTRIIEELEDSGDIDRWSRDCRCSNKDMINILIDSWDDPARLTVHRMLADTAVKCTITVLGNKRLYMQLGVASEDYSMYESRIARLEKLILRS